MHPRSAPKYFILLLTFCCVACTPDDAVGPGSAGPNAEGTNDEPITFNGRLDLGQNFDYAGQTIPDYIRRDNAAGRPLTNAGATLGRVLFYDRALSVDGTIACASCHRQELAFGDDAIASRGVGGLTTRHAMRLVNARFGAEGRYFWDKRAASLEEQTTMPVRDHIEMGFSGRVGEPSFSDLLERLRGLDHYRGLFAAAFGDDGITEGRIQEALAQFIRSLQSFDTRFDEGAQLVRNGGERFPNFTAAENRGRELFGGRPQYDHDGNRIGGGLGCGICHPGPEFGIVADSGNNGITGSIGNGLPEFDVTRSPSLRNLFQPDGTENGPFMHDGSLRTLAEVIDHYNDIPTLNPGLDARLIPGDRPQRLHVTEAERADLIAFLKTLSGNTIYTDERWSDPFVEE